MDITRRREESHKVADRGLLSCFFLLLLLLLLVMMMFIMFLLFFLRRCFSHELFKGHEVAFFFWVALSLMHKTD
jgi:fatty-acid desaturase